MGWLVLGLRPAVENAACGVTQKRCVHGPKSECPSRAPKTAEIRPKRRCVRMKVLIGVDPHKASVAVAAVNEAGELVERAHFSQNRAGLRALERWSRRFPERRWAVENAGGLGRHLAQRLSAAGESVVDVPPKLSARACGCSPLATPARTMGWTPSPPRWPLGATSGWRRSIPRPDRRCCACFPRGAKTWWPSVPGRSKQPARAPARPRSRRGSRNALDPPSSTHLARHTAPGHLGPPPPSIGFGDPARRPGTGAKDRGPERAHRGRGGSLRHRPRAPSS
jgi:Transposase